MQRTSESNYSVVSLFSGAGGLDVGLHLTGSYDLLACVELEPRYCETLRLNRDRGRFGTRDTRVIEADLGVYDPHALMREIGIGPGELDLLVGGPPCQSFSTAGRRGTVTDPRGAMLWHFLRFVEALQPKYFLMENVRGVLSAALRHRPIAARPENGGSSLRRDERPGSVIDAWVRDLPSEYRVDVFEVNAVNYGAPQLRERVLFIGNRVGDVVDFPEPTHAASPDAARLGLAPFRTLRDALSGFTENDPVLVDFSSRKKRYLSMVPPGGNWRTLPPAVAEESMGRAFHAKGGRSGWWRRLSWDLPSPTIVTLPNHASTAMCHPDEVRVLTVGECARVQEFPDGWVFAGTPQEQMTQVGNAVPVRLGIVAGEVIAAHLRAPSAARGSGRGVPRYRRVYVKSHVRTRQWFKGGRVYVWDGVGGNAHYGGRRRSEAPLEDLLPHVLAGADEPERLAE